MLATAEYLPGTSKKCSSGFLRRQYAKPIAGMANSKAAPAATPPAIAPVLEELLPEQMRTKQSVPYLFKYEQQ
jgi:hypothetical protein